MIIPGMRDVEKADLEAMGELLPEGWYTATVTEAEEGTSTNGNPFVQFVFTIQNPPQHKNRKLVDRVFFTAASLPIAKAKLAAIGYDTDSGDRTFSPADVVGRGVHLKVGHENGQNKDGLPRVYARVQVWKSSSTAMPSSTPASSGPKADDDIPF